MDKTKLIIGSLIILIFLGIIGLGILLLTAPKNAVPANTAPTQNSLPANYSLSVTEYKGAVTAVVDVNGQTTNLNSNNLSQYAVVTFNNPHDIMWVLCPSGYSQTNPTSSTKNQPAYDQGVRTSIEITAGNQNNLTVTCSK